MPPSPTSARRRLSAPKRRESILDAAAEVFGDVGYHRASVDAIAGRTGVTKPVIYDHFKSKPELYIAVLHHETERLLQAIGSTEPDQAPLEQRLADTAHGMFMYARARPHGWRMLFVDTPSEPAVEQAYRQLRAAGADLVAQITASDPDFEPPPGVDRAAAAQMIGQLQYSAYVGLGTWAHDHPDIPLDHVLAAFMDFTWMGLRQLRAGKHWNGTAGPTISVPP